MSEPEGDSDGDRLVALDASQLVDVDEEDELNLRGTIRGTTVVISGNNVPPWLPKCVPVTDHHLKEGEDDDAIVKHEWKIYPVERMILSAEQPPFLEVEDGYGGPEPPHLVRIPPVGSQICDRTLGAGMELDGDVPGMYIRSPFIKDEMKKDNFIPMREGEWLAEQQWSDSGVCTIQRNRVLTKVRLVRGNGTKTSRMVLNASSLGLLRIDNHPLGTTMPLAYPIPPEMMLKMKQKGVECERLNAKLPNAVASEWFGNLANRVYPDDQLVEKIKKELNKKDLRVLVMTLEDERYDFAYLISPIVAMTKTSQTDLIAQWKPIVEGHFDCFRYYVETKTPEVNLTIHELTRRFSYEGIVIPQVLRGENLQLDQVQKNVSKWHTQPGSDNTGKISVGMSIGIGEHTFGGNADKGSLVVETGWVPRFRVESDNKEKDIQVGKVYEKVYKKGIQVGKVYFAFKKEQQEQEQDETGPQDKTGALLGFFLVVVKRDKGNKAKGNKAKGKAKGNIFCLNMSGSDKQNGRLTEYVRDKTERHTFDSHDFGRRGFFDTGLNYETVTEHCPDSNSYIKKLIEALHSGESTPRNVVLNFSGIAWPDMARGIDRLIHKVDHTDYALPGDMQRFGVRIRELKLPSRGGERQISLDIPFTHKKGEFPTDLRYTTNLVDRSGKQQIRDSKTGMMKTINKLHKDGQSNGADWSTTTSGPHEYFNGNTGESLQAHDWVSGLWYGGAQTSDGPTHELTSDSDVDSDFNSDDVSLEEEDVDTASSEEDEDESAVESAGESAVESAGESGADSKMKVGESPGGGGGVGSKTPTVDPPSPDLRVWKRAKIAGAEADSGFLDAGASPPPRAPHSSPLTLSERRIAALRELHECWSDIRIQDLQDFGFPLEQ